MTDLRPPIHPVKVLPTKMGEADRLSRTRAAVWIYGSSTLLTMLCLKLQSQRCRQRRVQPEEAEHAEPLLESSRALSLEAKEVSAKPAEAKEQDAEREHRLTVGFVVYHMTYTYLGLILVFWACRKNYLNVYGLDWELYSFWFVEAAATHLICRAPPQKFLSSICPIISERYDLVKDTVSVGIYANLGHTVGYVCSAIVILTMIVPNLNNYLDPVTEELMRASYWPLPRDGGQKGVNSGTATDEETSKRTSFFHKMMVMCVKQVEEATREHRRMLCLLEDLPQLSVALFFTGYSYYTEGAAISPFIVVNICVALSKTICIFVGRPICLTWMAMNGVPWPLRCISRNNVQDVLRICHYHYTNALSEHAEDPRMHILGEILRSDEAARGARQAAEQYLWSRVQEKASNGLPLVRSDSGVEIDIVQHVEGTRMREAVLAYCASTEISFHEAEALQKKWETFSFFQNSDLLTLRGINEGSIDLNNSKAVRPDELGELARPLTQTFLNLLTTGSPRDQERAFKILGRIGTEETAVAVLSVCKPEIFSHKDHMMREAACRSMVMVSWEKFEGHAQELPRVAFEDESVDVRQAAWWALGFKGDIGVRLVHKQLASSDYFDSTDTMLTRALFAIRWMGSDADEIFDDKVLAVIEKVEKAEKEQLEPVWLHTWSGVAKWLLYFGRLDGLAKIWPSALKNCKNDECRRVLLSLAGYLQEPQVVDTVVNLLVSYKDPGGVRSYGMYHDPFLDSVLESARLLLPQLTSEHVSSICNIVEKQDVSVRTQLYACCLLANMKEVGKRPAPPVSFVVKQFQHEDPQIRNLAARTFGIFGTIPETLPHLPSLSQLLEDSDTVREAAAWAFGEFDAIPRMKEHIPALLASCTSAQVSTQSSYGYNRAPFFALQKLDIFKNGLVDEKDKRLILENAWRVKESEKKIQMKALDWADLLPPEEMELDLVKALAWLSFKKEAQMNSYGFLASSPWFHLQKLKQKGAKAVEDLLTEKDPSDLDFRKLLTCNIDSINVLEQNDPRILALCSYMLHGEWGLRSAAGRALSRCFGKAVVNLPEVQGILPALVLTQSTRTGSSTIPKVFLTPRAMMQENGF